MRPATTTFTLRHMAMVVFPSSTTAIDNPKVFRGFWVNRLVLHNHRSFSSCSSGDSKVDEGRGSFTASRMVSSFLPAVVLLDRHRGRDPSRAAGPKGLFELFERNFFGFDLRTTGVLALTGDASSVTPSSFIARNPTYWYPRVVWFPDPSCVGGAREGREERVW